jgi:hypothetical protein
MVARIRNVSTGKHYALFECKRQFLPVDTKAIKKYIGSTQNILETGIESNSLENLLTMEYDDNGICRLVENDALIIYLENKRIENLSKNNFIDRFLYQIKQTGVKIELLVDPEEELIAEHNISFNAMSKVYVAEEASKIINAADLSDEEMQNLLNYQQEQMDSGGEDLKIEDKLALHKKMLIKIYKIPPADLNLKFIKKYDNPAMKQIYRNIKMVDNFEQCVSEDGYYSVLENIRMIENEKGKLSTYDNEQINPTAGKDYARHRIALGLLLCCKFYSVKEWVPETDIIENLKKYHQKIKDCENTMRLAYDYFPALPITGDINYFNIMLKIINKIINEQYDIKIIKVPNKISYINRYEIQLSSSFNKPNTPAARKDKPAVIVNNTSGPIIDRILK